MSRPPLFPTQDFGLFVKPPVKRVSLFYAKRFLPFGLLLVVHLLGRLKGRRLLMLISICPITALESFILAQFIRIVTLWLSIPTYQSTAKCVTNICAPQLVSSFINCISSKPVSMRVKSIQLSEGLRSHARLFKFWSGRYHVSRWLSKFRNGLLLNKPADGTPEYALTSSISLPAV